MARGLHRLGSIFYFLSIVPLLMPGLAASQCGGGWRIWAGLAQGMSSTESVRKTFVYLTGGELVVGSDVYSLTTS